ncbi:butyrophilin subfamily 2 member A1-like isoform X1 [Seriola lalandi dorsalis]|uniref:butyrophilin subfamily 2 member A1-like isoform X1 n=1 Tax=Seriola lalandi dorsalis TaxID=1841481 RepID=UPI000C6F8E1E|nr:butyrophilin subfamily 2 member A1-like isoform X1 [Seriola lalandi dorsalis]
MRLFTVLFSALPLILGKYDVICPTETIQAEEGDDVTLRFDLDPRVNLSDYTLDVTRTDLNEVKLDEVVHAYRHGKDLTDPQTERYRHRTILIHEDLSRGIITLQISSVQLKDSGPYRCFVPELRAGCTTVLNVVKKVQHNKTKTDDVMTSTSPPNPDAETVNVGAVVAGVLVPVLIIIIIIVLVKRGTIRRSVERLRGRREEEPEKEKKKENLENSAETAC